MTSAPLTLRLAIVGRGRWGRNIERVLRALPDVSVVVLARGQAPPRDIDGVLLATPSATHADIALPYIAAGIATFIEKPMATTVADAERISHAARCSGAAVMVGHIQLYNPAFLALVDLLPSLGPVRHIICEGLNDNPRSDCSVLWDWLPHHLSTARAILGRNPVSVAAWVLSGTQLTEAAVTRFMFGDVPLLSIASWASHEPKRCMMIFAERGTIVFDDRSDRKLLVRHVDGSCSFPSYDNEMPLTRELKAFVDLIRSGGPTRSDAALGVSIVRMIDAAERALRGGMTVELPD
jgi:predicted dehydrogenase